MNDDIGILHMNIEDLLNKRLSIIDSEINKIFEKRIFSGTLYAMMKYHLGWLDGDLKKIEEYRGKRFRPTLCLLVYSSLCGVESKVLPAAAAIELIHNFSLIHDDIEDMDEKRRHKPTVWKIWGINHAINVGDGMHVLANLSALRLKELNVSDTKIVEIMQILNESIITLCEGQYQDMDFENRLDITIEMYLKMINFKTAVLIEASTWIGATLATENKKIVNNFRKFGRNIGIAFQIIDDIMGIWGKSSKTGKPHASDIRNKKKTLPIIYAIQMASIKQKKRINELYKNNKITNDEIQEIFDILEDTGALEYAKNTANEFEVKALKELSKTKINNEDLNDIKLISNFLVKRDY
jgi:geranylgeranyl diphosphate synthase type I|tara:strand:- start:1662 stop:2720 length:1059 start_codon:yes stop_codon:yes gene_type:complete